MIGPDVIAARHQFSRCLKVTKKAEKQLMPDYHKLFESTDERILTTTQRFLYLVSELAPRSVVTAVVSFFRVEGNRLVGVQQQPNVHACVAIHVVQSARA